MIDRFTGDEQAHDLRRSLEDQVDPEVPHGPLDRDRRLPPGAERIGRLVAAAAANLQRVVDNPPAVLRVVHLGDRRFQSDVVVPAFGQSNGKTGDRLHGKCVGRHHRHLLRNRLVFADRRAPLHALVRPGARRLQQGLAAAGRTGRQRQTPCVERDERQLESFPFAPENVLARHAYVGEPDDAVLDRLEAHEPAPMHDFDARPRRLDDERRDLLARLAIHDGVRRARHHHEQLGARAIRAPQLLAVEDELRATWRQLGVGLHVRRIGPRVHLRERECADRALGEPRKKLLLLFSGSEQLERLRQPNGLMGREERGQRSVLRRDHRHRLDVRGVRQPKPTVFGGDLDAKGTHVAQLLDVILRDVACAVDHVGVNPLQKCSELVEERFRARSLGGVFSWVGMDQVEPKAAEEQFANEARTRPFTLSRRFSDVARFLLGGETSRVLCHGDSVDGVTV